MSATSIKVLVTAGGIGVRIGSERRCGLGGTGRNSAAGSYPGAAVTVRLAGRKQLTQNPNVITFKTTKNKYDLVTVSALSQSKFRDLLEDYENRGWEYAVPLRWPTRSGNSCGSSGAR